MTHRLSAYSLVVLLGAAGIAPAAGSRRPFATRDLDSLSTAQLSAYLEAELDDIYEVGPADAPVEIGELEEEIMAALDDADDSGTETVISLEDLEDEMGEDETTLEDVVHEALEAIDRADVENAAPDARDGIENGGGTSLRSTRRLAVQQSKREIIREIQAVRR